MTEPRTLGCVIRRRRLELGWTQEQLAERISAEDEYIRQSDISRIERGDIALPRRARLERIAAALDLPLGELLARSGWADAEACFASESAADGDEGPTRPAAGAPLVTANRRTGRDTLVKIEPTIDRFQTLSDSLRDRARELGEVRAALARTRGTLSPPATSEAPR